MEGVDRRTVLSLLGAGSAALAVPPRAAAQAGYPTRPVTFVVPYAAGGPTDVVGRLFAQEMGQTLGQQIVIENRAGAGGNVGTEAVSRLPPDGYALLVGTVTTQVLAGLLYRALRYDPVGDFTPVALFGEVPMVLVVNPASGIRSLAELLARLRAEPGKLNYGSSGHGAISHLTALLMLARAGANAVHVPYRGTGPAVTGLLGGEIQFVCDALSGVAGQIEGGAVRPLAVAAERRVAKYPDIPTFAEAGLPGVVSSTWNGLLGPKGLPAPIVERLHREAVAAMRKIDASGRARDLSLTIRPDLSPEGFAAFIAAGVETWRPIIQEQGIKLE